MIKNWNVNMDPVALIESLGIDPHGSPNRAMTIVGEYIDDSADKQLAANTILMGLTGRRESTIIEADIVAKYVVKRVMEDKDAFDREAAYKWARDMATRLLQKRPELEAFNAPEVDPDAPTTNANGRANRSNNQKKAAAEVIYNDMIGKPAGEIATAIAKELDISYSNAYYYVSRVFGKEKKKLKSLESKIIPKSKKRK